MTTTYDELSTFDAGHHDTIAGCERSRAETFRSYRTWATDPDLLAWADAMAAACDAQAAAHERLAAVVRDRRSGSEAVAANYADLVQHVADTAAVVRDRQAVTG